MSLVRVLLVCLLVGAAGCSAQREDGAAGTGDGGGGSGVAAPAVAEEVAFAPDDPQGAGTGPNRLGREQIEEGWIRLFDGRTLFGWTPNSDTNWRVEDGEIHADSGGAGLLRTTTRFADYELLCDFQLEQGGNSGIFLRTPHKPSDPARDCYELNICDSRESFATGSLVGRVQSGRKVAVEGEWHTFHVRLEGPRMQVSLDGEPLTDFTDDSDDPLTSGFIGLQMNGGHVVFRNVFLRPLGTKPLFNGTDLSGWREVPGSESTFDVADGTIRVTGGRGFLETEETFGDFVLQAQAITHGTHLNSGIFFRAMPGTVETPSHGYELQIHNGFKDGDRTQPIDHGTGAIFRRAPARRVVPDDNQWFTLTLVADGPRFTSWVDGFQVIDWTDDRQPNPNPREGLRLEAGHLSLQGHDPTTNLNFRNLRIAELPPVAE